MPLSFSESSVLLYPIQTFSLNWYHALFHSDAWIRAAKNSFIVAPSATLIATVLGTLAAAGLHRTEFPGKSLLMAVLISPMIVPLVVVGVGIYLFFAPYGLTSSYIGLILAHAALGAPFVVTTVTATLQGFDQNLTRASYRLGARPIHTFFNITLPIIAPGRSEEHTSELQSLMRISYAVFCLKKKIKNHNRHSNHHTNTKII